MKFKYDIEKIQKYYENVYISNLFVKTIIFLNSDILLVIDVIKEIREYIQKFQNHYWCIDGPIAAGKSYIIKQNLEKRNVIIKEPIDLWRLITVTFNTQYLTHENDNILDFFYKTKHEDIQNRGMFFCILIKFFF